MITIKLTQGQETVIDDIDSDLSNLKWYANNTRDHSFYARRSVSKPLKYKLYLHRVIMERMLGRSLDSKEQVDHINLNKLDNRRENLRLATDNENMHNRIKYSNNKSGYKGVYWHTQLKKWVANIWVNGERIHLGVFINIENAVEAYQRASEKYHGEFGRTE